MIRSIIAGFCAMSMRPLAFFAVLSVAAIVHAAVAPAPPAAELPQPVSAATPAPGVAAQSYFLLDTLSGQTPAPGNVAEKRYPASLTTFMTAYLVFGPLQSKAI